MGHPQKHRHKREISLTLRGAFGMTARLGFFTRPSLSVFDL